MNATAALAQAEIAPPQHVGATGPRHESCAAHAHEGKEREQVTGQVVGWTGAGMSSSSRGLERKLQLLRLLQDEGEEMLAAAGH